MKPCMICLYKKLKRIPLKNSGMICTLIKNLPLSQKKLEENNFCNTTLQIQPHVIRGREAKCIQGLKNQICTTEYFEAYCQLYLPSKICLQNTCIIVFFKQTPLFDLS